MSDRRSVSRTRPSTSSSWFNVYVAAAGSEVAQDKRAVEDKGDEPIFECALNIG
jgi:hypothetical protein